MIGLCLKFRKVRLIRTKFNKALFRVEEARKKKKKEKKYTILGLTLASCAGLARA